MEDISKAGLILCAGLALAAGCNKEGGAGGGTKTCPEGAPLCVNLPSGYTTDDPRSGAWGGNISVIAADKSQVAMLYWVKPEEFETRTAMSATKVKATKGKDEQTLAGKGRYLEWDASDPKEDHHFVENYIKTDKNTLQCTGSTPKGDAAKIATLQGICKSMAPK